MCARFKIVSILIFISLVLVFVSGKKKVKKGKVKPKHGPGGMSFDDTTTCEEFSKFARFNPYSVLGVKWFVFFYWSSPQPFETYVFTFPTRNHTKHLHRILDGKTILPVDWSARQILMEDHKNVTSLLVERGDRGEFWQYFLYKVTKGDKITPRDVRLKQTGDSRILGFMDCNRRSLLVMSKINDVPPKKHLLEEASRLGFRGRRGKSYLYQGHEWMPIPEADEKNYWAPTNKDKTPEKSSEEANSSEQSSEEGQPNNMPTQPEEEKRKDEKPPKLSTHEEDLKEKCYEVKPTFWDEEENVDVYNKKEILTITKEQLESNEIETEQTTEAPDFNLPSNKPTEGLDIKSVKDEIELDEQQTTNKTGNSTSINTELQPTRELDADVCDRIHEEKHGYIKTTKKSYIPESAHSSIILESPPTNIEKEVPKSPEPVAKE